MAPKTPAGRLFCVFYGLFGVPLCLTWINALGKFFGGRAKRLGQFLTKRGMSLVCPQPQVLAERRGPWQEMGGWQGSKNWTEVLDGKGAISAPALLGQAGTLPLPSSGW